MFISKCMLGNDTNTFLTLDIYASETYDVTNENMGRHGLILYILRMVTVKNTKKLELGFSINQFPYITDLKGLPLIVCFVHESVDKLATNNLFSSKISKSKMAPIHGC